MTIANITKSEEGQDSEALINERTYLVPKIEKVWFKQRQGERVG